MSLSNTWNGFNRLMPNPGTNSIKQNTHSLIFFFCWCLKAMLAGSIVLISRHLGSAKSRGLGLMEELGEFSTSLFIARAFLFQPISLSLGIFF